MPDGLRLGCVYYKAELGLIWNWINCAQAVLPYLRILLQFRDLIMEELPLQDD